LAGGQTGVLTGQAGRCIEGQTKGLISRTDWRSVRMEQEHWTGAQLTGSFGRQDIGWKEKCRLEDW